ncbi:MAG: alpha/beta fold hydrolase [Aureispira sp.]
MKQFLLFLLCYCSALVATSQSLYVNTFGNPKDQPLIFLHGGPGYNSVAFEQTTAQALAKQGFYVVVYDRRGEGRSVTLEADFTWEQSIKDLQQLYRQLHLKKAILLGHSFGGMLATLYAEQYPKRVQGIVLMGAPLNMQTTFEHIRTRCTAIYEEKEDAVNLYYMSLLKDMDKRSMDYASYCFAHAMQNGFYSPSTPSEEATTLYQLFRTDPVLQQYAAQMTKEAPSGFWKNEQYTTLDLHNNLTTVLQHQVPVLGLYGQEDGLFSPQQVQQLEQLIGNKNLYYWANCSHNVFIDQQTLFFNTLTTWLTAYE